MLRTITLAMLATAAVALAYSGLHSGRPRALAANVATVDPATASPTGKPISRRERMARLVAETAAINAERTAKQVLAGKGRIQQTAAR